MTTDSTAIMHGLLRAYDHNVQKLNALQYNRIILRARSSWKIIYARIHFARGFFAVQGVLDYGGKTLVKMQRIVLLHTHIFGCTVKA